MRLEKFKLLLVSVGLILALVIASPAISGLISYPSGEQFSEFFLLGTERMAEGYPHSIVPDQKYTVYFGVGNHVGSLTYYLVNIKLLSDSERLPDVDAEADSPSEVLQEYRFIVEDEQVYEKALTFSFSNTTISNNQLTVGNLQLNGENIKVDKVAIWNSTKSEYPYKLLLELWVYNSQSSGFEFNNRFVYIQLNCTGAI